MVGSDRPDNWASLRWSIWSIARAARSCAAVIMLDISVLMTKRSIFAFTIGKVRFQAGRNFCCWNLFHAPNVRFSNRPVGVKRFQTIHGCDADVARGLVLLYGIGTQGPSIMGSEDEAEQSLGRPCRGCRQVQADMRTHLIHRPARDIIPPLGGARVSSYRI